MLSNVALTKMSVTSQPHYLEKGLLPRNPFESLDRDGVGALVDAAVHRCRRTVEAMPVGCVKTCLFV